MSRYALYNQWLYRIFFALFSLLFACSAFLLSFSVEADIYTHTCSDVITQVNHTITDRKIDSIEYEYQI